MASFRETREVLHTIKTWKLMKNLFYCTSKNFDYPFWNYNRFDLHDWSDEERRSDLRFYKPDVYRLFEVLNIPVLTT